MNPVEEVRSASTELLTSDSLKEMKALLQTTFEERQDIAWQLQTSRSEKAHAGQRYVSWENGFLFKRIFTKAFALRKTTLEEVTEKVSELEEQVVAEQQDGREYQKRDKTIGMSSYVFHHKGEPIGDIRKSWDAACKQARVEGKIFHDLRRTAIRNMIRAGVPERVAMAISGHRTRAVFDRYNIVSEDDLRSAMEKTSAYLSASQKQNVTTFPARKRAAAK